MIRLPIGITLMTLFDWIIQLEIGAVPNGIRPRGYFK